MVPNYLKSVIQKLIYFWPAHGVSILIADSALVAHPLMTQYGVDAVPFQHEKMDEWRDSFRRRKRIV